MLKAPGMELTNKGEKNKFCCIVQKSSQKLWCHDTRHGDIYHNDTQHGEVYHNDTQHNIHSLCLWCPAECRARYCLAMCHYAECQYNTRCCYAETRSNIEYCRAECHYTECWYAECHYAECRSAKIIPYDSSKNRLVPVL
jgi:hypothetical protein